MDPRPITDADILPEPLLEELIAEQTLLHSEVRHAEERLGAIHDKLYRSAVARREKLDREAAGGNPSGKLLRIRLARRTS